MIRRAVTILLAVGALGCGNPFEAFLRPVPEIPTEATLFDFRTGDVRDQVAFDAILRVTARVDQTNQWDFLLFITETGVAQLRPFGAVATFETDAGLQRVDTSFEGLRSAPVDGYLQGDPVEVEVGDVLAVQTRRDPSIRSRCRRYAKIEILEIDPLAATLTFQHLANPNCEDRVLVPGQRGSL